MKKLISVFLLYSGLLTSLLAQKGVQTNSLPEAELKPTVQASLVKRAKNTSPKSPGTVHYSEDFSSGGPLANQLPNGWTVQNFAGNSYNWIWSTSAPGGQYSANVTALNSTTASNGFISLPSDFYNTASLIFVSMDASITSPRISLNPSVTNYVIQWEQALNYCCRVSDELVLEVSTDSISWTSFDATQGRSPSTPSPNGELVSINVSSALSAQSFAYIRFRQTGASHFYWMIDDLKLIESNPVSVQFNDFAVLFGDTFSINTNYTKVPLEILPRILVGGQIQSNSNFTHTNVKFFGNLYLDSTSSGNANPILIDQDSVIRSTVIAPFTTITDTVGYLNANQRGKMNIEFYMTSDLINQASAQKQVYQFEVSDTVIAKDYGVFNTSTSVASFQSGGNDGDQWGTLISVGGSGATIRSISVYVANDSNVIGSSIRAMLYEVSPSNNAINLVMAGNVVKTITSSDTAKWISIPYNSGAGFGPLHILHPGRQYIVAWEQVSGASSGSYFATGRDTSAEKYAPPVSNFIYLPSTQNWSWINHVAGLRANIYPQTTVSLNEVEEEQSSLQAFPNPTNGFLQIKNLPLDAHTLQIRNLSGQLVHQEKITPGQKQVQLDLSQLHKAIYFLVVRGSSTQKVEKVLLN